MVTIIGGGIAGTALAGACAAAGHPATVYEQQPEHREGAFLFLDGRGHRVLTAFGVAEEALQAASHPVDELRWVSTNGRSSARPSDGHRLWLRGNLIRVLTAFAADTGADIHFDSTVDSLSVESTHTSIGVGAVSLECRGLVLGADGIDSGVRRRLEPDRKPEYAGHFVFYGAAARPVDLPTTLSVLHFHAEADTGATFGHWWHGPAAYWFARIPGEPLLRESTGPQPTAEWEHALLAAFPGISPIVSALLSSTDIAHVSNARSLPLEAAKPPREPVVLLGDADHAITPAAGTGARDALEDAAAIYTAVQAGESVADAMAGRRATLGAERAQIAQAMGRARIR